METSTIVNMEEFKGEERAFDQIENHGISTALNLDKKCKEERFKNFDRESTSSRRHLTESNISKIPNLEDECSNTDQQEAVVLSQSRLESLTRARTNMYQLLTLVGSFAIALYAGLMVAMYEVSKADGSPQQLRKGTLIVSISSVVIFVCCVSGVGLFLVYQRNITYHPCKSLYVRLLRMTFFFTAFSSPFLLLTGMFVPTKQLWAPLFFTLYVYICTLLASAFLGIPTEPDSPAPTKDHDLAAQEV